MGVIGHREEGRGQSAVEGDEQRQGTGHSQSTGQASVFPWLAECSTVNVREGRGERERERERCIYIKLVSTNPSDHKHSN